MSRIVIMGAGTVGLTTAMLLRHEGHDVTVLERDPDPVPEPERAWQGWTRRGVGQFHLPHHYSARFARTIERELPTLAARFVESGALAWNPIEVVPGAVTGGWRRGDERFGVFTGRRPFMEAVAARHASDLGVTIRRGVVVSGVAHHTLDDDTVEVTGVVIDGGEAIRADLVVDAGGRRSPMPTMIRSTGSSGPIETRHDAGYVYYARHFRGDGTMPPLLGGVLQPYGSISIATLPAERGTWCVVVFARSGDRALAGLRRIEAWERVVRAFPLVSHWIDAEPITAVDVMASIEDRRCDYLVDGRPIAVGMVPVGDAWASTSPSLGRGSSIGAMHAVALRDVLRQVPATDRRGVASAFHTVSRQKIAPWIDDTSGFDRHRLAEMHAAANGEPYLTTDTMWYLGQVLARSASKDPDLFRHQLSVTQTLRRLTDVMTDPRVAARAAALADRTPAPGPDRAQLIDLVHVPVFEPTRERELELIAR